VFRTAACQINRAQTSRRPWRQLQHGNTARPAPLPRQLGRLSGLFPARGVLLGHGIPAPSRAQISDRSIKLTFLGLGTKEIASPFAWHPSNSESLAVIDVESWLIFSGETGTEPHIALALIATCRASHIHFAPLPPVTGCTAAQFIQTIPGGRPLRFYIWVAWSKVQSTKVPKRLSFAKNSGDRPSGDGGWPHITPPPPPPPPPPTPPPRRWLQPYG